uniref:Uncharacterized protein n=1 Tax=Strigamia maritima TaxID=126957 RepID=T1JFY2_STRMM
MDRRVNKNQAPCSTTRPRKMIAAMERGPGPGVYLLPPTIGFKGQDKTKLTGPAFTLRGLIRQKPVTYGPGPAVYSLPTNMTRYGYSYSPDYTNAPAPGTYNLSKGHMCKGQFTFGQRIDYRSPYAGPPPNAYILPPTMGLSLALYPSNRGFSLRSRLKAGSITQDTAQSPGPAQYPSVNVTRFKQCGPKFTMGSRPDVKHKTVGPGPASYTLPYDLKRSAAFSFGCKHSEFAPPLITKSD